MTTHEFTNQSSQSERREVLRNDTYFARQSNSVDDAGGRYAKLTPATITGATTPQYPPLPASSPWAHGFDTNIEPPLSVDVNAMEPTGTPSEVQASLDPTLNSPVVNAPPAAVEDRCVGEPVVDVVSSPLSTEATRSLNNRRGL